MYPGASGTDHNSGPSSNSVAGRDSSAVSFNQRLQDGRSLPPRLFSVPNRMPDRNCFGCRAFQKRREKGAKAKTCRQIRQGID